MQHGRVWVWRCVLINVCRLKKILMLCVGKVVGLSELVRGNCAIPLCARVLLFMKDRLGLPLLWEKISHLNLVWLTLSSSTAWLSASLSEISNSNFSIQALYVLVCSWCCPPMRAWVFRPTKRSTGQAVSFYPGFSSELQESVDSRAARGLEGGGEEEEGGSQRWGSAAHPQLGHQSRSVACRCTF